MKICLSAVEPRLEHSLSAARAQARSVLTSFFYARDIMKICLSAFESATEYSLACAKAEVPSALTSFYKCRDEIGSIDRRSAWEICLRQASLRLADSGAFTFRMAGLGASQSDSGSLDTNLDTYLAEYVTWLQSVTRSGLIDYWVELDVGVVMGRPWVEKQRDIIIGAGLGPGLINVWHGREHSFDDWVDLVEESRLPGRSGYVAIEGHQQGQPVHAYERFIKVAYDRGVKVHAFKITGADDLKRWPFYSVDSTSWLAAVRYGRPGATLRTGGVTGSGTGGTDRRTTYRAAVNPGTNARERYDICVAQAKAWVVAERQLTDLWLSRGIDWDRAISQPKVIT